MKTELDAYRHAFAKPSIISDSSLTEMPNMQMVTQRKEEKEEESCSMGDK